MTALPDRNRFGSGAPPRAPWSWPPPLPPPLFPRRRPFLSSPRTFTARGHTARLPAGMRDAAADTQAAVIRRGLSA